MIRIVVLANTFGAVAAVIVSIVLLFIDLNHATASILIVVIAAIPAIAAYKTAESTHSITRYGTTIIVQSLLAKVDYSKEEEIEQLVHELEYGALTFLNGIRISKDHKSFSLSPSQHDNLAALANRTLILLQASKFDERQRIAEEDVKQFGEPVRVAA